MMPLGKTLLGFVMVVASVGPAMAAGVPGGAGDGESTVWVVSGYQPGDGTVNVGGESYRLSPVAAGSLAEQLRQRAFKAEHFGALIRFGQDPLGRPQVNAIRVVP